MLFALKCYLKTCSCKEDIYIFHKLQVRKRERMAKLREDIAVQKAKETELNKTIHITGLITQPNLNL